MRKFALILPLALALGACTWQERNANLSAEHKELGLKDAETLTAEYARSQKYAGLNRAIDGRTNALHRDFSNIWATVDRSFFNYSATDPYVNHATQDNYWDATVWGVGYGLGENVLPILPVK